jgi:hypothetical protein
LKKISIRFFSEREKERKREREKERKREREKERKREREKERKRESRHQNPLFFFIFCYLFYRRNNVWEWTGFQVSINFFELRKIFLSHKKLTLKRKNFCKVISPIPGTFKIP